ncbi:MAG: outer membrane beta-barrel protein [Janthinobacterium lividum]
MHVNRLVLAAALLAPAAQAQQVQQSREDDSAPAQAPRLSAEAPGRFGPLAEGFKRYQPLYGGNETANPNDRQFTGFRTDPRLVLGYAFNDNFAIETGYAFLRDEGFHKIEPGPVEQALAAGDLRAKSHTVHVAARLTVPLGDRLSAYGKLGVAHSVVKDDGLLPRSATVRGEPLGSTGKGAYGAIGAKYKVNDRTTLSGEVRSNGSANKFGPASNAGGVKGSLGIGF